jgi:hypothetical protein
MAKKTKQSAQTRRAVANCTHKPSRRNADFLFVSELNARERAKNRDRSVKERQQWRNRHRSD